VSWTSDAERDVLQGSHDGYRRLLLPVDHTRRITFDKQRGRWRIDDSLTGRGEHLVELFFHPAVPFEVEDRRVCLRAPEADLWLLPPDDMSFRTEPGWISRGYGLREPAVVLVYAVRGVVPVYLRTNLVLAPRGTSAAVARSLAERD
jgi:uncharacterized heparinase superfamily protein